MQAVRFHGPGEGLRVETVARPDPGPGELLLEVAACGLCHSDLHIMDGDLPLTPPQTLGHETTGTVVETGAGVDHIEPGTDAAVFGGWGCGHCRVCTRGEDQLCNLMSWQGIGTDGGLAEYLLVPDPRYVLPIPELDPVEAVPLTDAALTPYRAVRRAREHIDPADTVVTVGVGGLGQYGVQFAAMTGAKVIAADVDDRKLELAAELGADVTVNTNTQRLPSVVRSESDGGGAAVAIDFVGKDETLQACGNVLGTGGHLYIVGIGGGSFELSFNPLFGSELTATNVFWGGINELRDVLNLARDGRLDMGIERVGFDEVADAYDRLEHGEIERRAVLVP